MERIKVLTILSLFLFICLFLKLFQKQILQSKAYSELAFQQQTVKKEIIPKRGEVFVKEQGEETLYPLATNITLYAVSVVPKQVKDPKKVAKELALLLSLDEKELFNQINNKKPYLPPLKRKLNEEEAKKIKDLNLEGVYLEEENYRCYPEGERAAHVLGFVDAQGDGKYGVEGFYDKELKGQKGLIFVEKDIKGRYISLLNKNKTQDGLSLVLTLDRTVQYMAESKLKEGVEKFKAESGSILIMDPKTGAILAMASYPFFDPNKYNEVKKEDYGIFTNPVIGEVWEPGSVFKIITMAAGIDSNKITKETKRYFEAKINVDGHDIWTYDKKSQGEQTMTQVLETSNNVGAVFVVGEIGKELFSKYLKNFGFGSLIGIDLEKEVNKSLKPWESWRNVELATMGFGQGIAITPLQLAVATSAISNGGKLVLPHIVAEIINPDGKRETVKPKEIRQVISPSSAEIISEMMVSVVEKGHGKRAGVPGYKVAGKTGTAQIPKKGGGYEENQSIGSFVGFAPAENPRFVMLVKIDRPKTVEWAESSAAPVFGEMAKWLLEYYQVSPTEVSE